MYMSSRLFLLIITMMMADPGHGGLASMKAASGQGWGISSYW